MLTVQHTFLNKTLNQITGHIFVLHEVARSKIMKMLDISKPLSNSQKWEIFREACIYGRHDICAYLSELFQVQLLQVDKREYGHCLQLIAIIGSVECFQIAASFFIQDCQSDEERKLSFKTLTDELGSNVLHMAILARQRQMILYLMKQYHYLLRQKNLIGASGLSLIANTCMLGILTQRDIESVFKSMCQNGMTESLIDEDGKTILLWACSSGNEELCVKLLPISPANLLKNRNGISCLHHIACSGKIEWFKAATALIIKNQNNLDIEKLLEDSNGFTALHYACVNGHRVMSSYLITKYPRLIHKKDQIDRHCLHFIAMSGNVESFQSIAALALRDMNDKERQLFIETLIDKNGLTVLNYACSKGHRDISVNLIEKYPRLLNQKDEIDHHCLHYIAMSGNVECFQSIAAFALKDMNDKERQRFFETLIDKNGWTVLHYACSKGHKDISVNLIEKYPRLLNQKDKIDHHCLHFIAMSGNVESFQSIAAFALKDMNDKDRQRFIETLIDKKGWTVLHHACFKGHRDISFHLIEKYPRLLHQKDQIDQHCLHFIAMSGNVECFHSIAALALKDMNDNGRQRFMETLIDKKGLTVLHHACFKGHRDISFHLIEKYPRLLHQKDQIDQHCLHFIAMSGNVECFQSIAAFALKDMNDKERQRFFETLIDKKGWTVLHHACFKGHRDISFHLIEKYPRLLHQKDQIDHHCLHLIAELGNVECFQAIAALALKDMNETERELFMESLIDKNGWTVLHVACLIGNKDFCLELVENFPRLFSQTDKIGRHCLHLIAQLGNVECFQSITLLALKDVNETEREQFLEALVDNKGWTVLYHACLNGRTDLCLNLIEKYPRLFSQRDQMDRHCLHLIAMSGNVKCFQSITHLALKDMNEAERERFQDALVDNNGWTVLHYSCLNGRNDLCLDLIKKFPRLFSQKDPMDRHCLHLNAMSGNVKCFQSITLLALKDMNETERELFMETLIDKNGLTVLHFACLNGRTDLCLDLIEKYPRLFSQKDPMDRHCLHLNAMSGNVNCFQSITRLALKI
ncbi:serine/threonine-protein phosphatase 6 regulatory ankyrin repeat subunit B-like [Pecten maximus]|uniref:serine/threonine-protein phosphatase 6 regulatory ankyrin repeat subunit B-like n=1 Tax=Pecten maximus TaxID=6579 RepID=UPI00145832F0|nr:serine/threonine-protein phosphatase 6 regulatory ankyrin repeat subunit B-like [Pecten maximus]